MDSSLSQLYETDETAWLQQMAKHIEFRQYDQLDYENLRSYLLDAVHRDRRETMGRMTRLLTNRLNWDYQPGKRSRQLSATILMEKDELESLLESQTLMRYALEVSPKAFVRARKLVLIESGMHESDLPTKCPFSLEELLTIDK